MGTRSWKVVETGSSWGTSTAIGFSSFPTEYLGSHENLSITFPSPLAPGSDCSPAVVGMLRRITKADPKANCKSHDPPNLGYITSNVMA